MKDGYLRGSRKKMKEYFNWQEKVKEGVRKEVVLVK